VAGVTAQFYMACDRPGLNSLFALVNVVVSAALMLLLTPRYGAPGAAFGLLCGTVARLALLWVGMIVHLRVPLPRLWLGPGDLQSARVMFGP
jgi:O-antigen/teichoic acid export membrane protein